MPASGVLLHSDWTSLLSGYRRSTRFQKADGSLPKYIALHEFDTSSIPPETSYVLGTEWSKKVLGGATSKALDVWEVISEYGKSGIAGERF